MPTEPKKKRKSSEYSRKGCVQCKKSHVKCDEKTPICSRCSKKGTKCEYIFNVMIENSQSKKFRSNSTSVPASQTNILNFQSEMIDSLRTPDIAPVPSAVNGLSVIGDHNYKGLSDARLELKKFPDQRNISESPDNTNDQHVNAGGNQSHLLSDSNAQLEISTRNLNHSILDYVPKNGLGPNVYGPSISENSDKSSQSQFSINRLRLNDLISVQPKDLIYLTKDGLDVENDTYFYEDTIYPNLSVFHIPWDGGPLVYFIDLIKNHDPLILNSKISLNDLKIIDFVWTMGKLTKFFYIFILYSEDSLINVFNLCFKLGSKHSIFQSILTYHCSLHMVRLYTETDNSVLANLWEFHVRIPSFKQCIDYLKDGLENSNSFSDLVILTFAVLIIFSGNASDSSWRAHLSGCYQLICKSQHLKKKQLNQFTDFDFEADKLFDIIIEWYKNTSFFASISSLNGFFTKQLTINNYDSNRPNLSIAKNNINLMSGSCLELKILYLDIYQFFNTFNEKKIKLSGLHFIHFIKTDHPLDLFNEIKIKGYQFLSDLNALIKDYNYERLNLEDFRMDLTMKYCNLITFNGLRLFLNYFFIGLRDVTKIKLILRDILDYFYSMPYKSSCAIICHYYIYISAIVSLLIEDFEIYGHFVGILRVFQLNGMEIPTIEILKRIKLILFEKNYEKLLSIENDFVIY